MNPDSILSDTVKADLIPVDLVSIIETCKKEQAEKHGESAGYCLSEYQKALSNIKQGTYKQRLQDDRLARDVVRAIINSDKLLSFEGNDKQYHSDRSITFPSSSNEIVRQKICDLREDGLLDFTFFDCGSPNVYCFQTELIYWREENRRIGKDPTYQDMQQYIPNLKVKEAISRMLEPFKTEKPLYTIPVPVKGKSMLF